VRAHVQPILVYLGLVGGHPALAGGPLGLAMHICRPCFRKDRPNGVQCSPQALKTPNPRPWARGENDPDVPAARRMNIVRWSIVRAGRDDDPMMECRVIAATVAYKRRNYVTGCRQPFDHKSVFVWAESARWKLADSVSHGRYYLRATEFVKQMIAIIRPATAGPSLCR
jgi:hypothetical protein